MLYSQNGYSAGNATLMAAYTVPSTKIRVVLRRGDTSVILLYLLEQYHHTVEPLHQDDTGGYNPRSILGSKVPSNHGSGTAADTRWNKHVRGRRGTFTSAQVAAIRRILAFLDGAVRWGGDYKHAMIDEMHFEIVGGPALVARTADRVRMRRDRPTGKPAPHAPPWPRGTPAFRESASPRYSPTVRAWQARVHLTADGRYGHRSADAAAALQKQKHLTVDRMLGPKTFAAAWSA